MQYAWVIVMFMLYIVFVHHVIFLFSTHTLNMGIYCMLLGHRLSSIGVYPLHTGKGLTIFPMHLYRLFN
ncbi:hypothetical protein D3C78_1903440 [compost metagenome]